MRYDDPKVTTSVIAGIIGAVVLFVVIVLLQALFYRMQAAERVRKVESQPNQELELVDAEQLQLLNSYGWVDQSNGVVRIPIDEAMRLVVAEQPERTE